MSALLAAALLAAAPVAPSSVDRFDAIAGTAVSLHASPSVDVAVVESNRIVYDRVAGDARPDTVYVVGSVTKMFTATSIFQLVDKGSIRLDDPLATYLPAFPHAKEITIRQLLGHRSGVPNYADIAVSNGAVYKPTTPQHILAWAAARPLDFAPGTKWAYSNTGYVLLGQIVERVTHEPLARYEQTHIFAPAGMTHTAMAAVAPGATLADPYLVTRGMYLKLAPASLSWYYACGDIVSNAADLARFDIALMQHRLVSAQSFAAMQRVVSTSTIAKGYDDGLGTFTHVAGGVTVVGHHGGEPGYTADNEFVPQDGFALVMLDNGFADTDGTVDAILAALYGKAAVPDAPDVADAKRRFATFVSTIQAGTLDPATLDEKMKAAMTPSVVAQVVGLVKSWGAIQTTTFVQKSSQGGVTAYYFRVTAAKGTHLVEFPLDDATKLIAGFLLPNG